MNRPILVTSTIVIALGLALAASLPAAHGEPSGTDPGTTGHMGHRTGMRAMGHGMGMGMGTAGHGMGMGAAGPGMGDAGHRTGMGPMRGGPTAMLTRQDAGSAADMDVVHALLGSHDRIVRNVARLPDGIRTVTESDDPGVAKSIQVHVASMSQRLEDGREFNLFSDSLPVLFANRDKIASRVEMTAKGAAVTRTSSDPQVVAALHAHAGEVTELVDDGMSAMHRGMMRRMRMADATPVGGGHRH